MWLNVNWYAVHKNIYKDESHINFFNRQEGMRAFIPKVEKWYGASHVRNYVLKDLYPDYMFIVTHMDKEVLFKKYKEFLYSENNILTLSDEEQSLMEFFYSNSDEIKHSVGNIVNSKLIVDKGPLLNYEGKITKIDRHHRTATLKSIFLNDKFLVPLEVVSKS